MTVCPQDRRQLYCLPDGVALMTFRNGLAMTWQAQRAQAGFTAQPITEGGVAVFPKISGISALPRCRLGRQCHGGPAAGPCGAEHVIATREGVALMPHHQAAINQCHAEVVIATAVARRKVVAVTRLPSAVADAECMPENLQLVGRQSVR